MQLSLMIMTIYKNYFECTCSSLKFAKPGEFLKCLILKKQIVDIIITYIDF